MQPERDLAKEAGFPHLLYTSQAQGRLMSVH